MCWITYSSVSQQVALDVVLGVLMRLLLPAAQHLDQERDTTNSGRWLEPMVRAPSLALHDQKIPLVHSEPLTGVDYFSSGLPNQK